MARVFSIADTAIGRRIADPGLLPARHKTRG